MSKLRLVKYPKRPKTRASLVTKERYIQRIKEIDRINKKLISDHKKQAQREKKINGYLTTMRAGSKTLVKYFNSRGAKRK